MALPRLSKLFGAATLVMAAGLMSADIQAADHVGPDQGKTPAIAEKSQDTGFSPVAATFMAGLMAVICSLPFFAAYDKRGMVPDPDYFADDMPCAPRPPSVS